ncbi:uncharacterized protein BDW43DRAFT_310905 [Aspergillus alliaceus]|uniref:uncharacterized protein n=1 Tax=Petromyces alliaceus TaxID=209559 RepID=UPI0012A6A805|nr:uncharacterized protein BDW43DRAFT_310905 [Aspergillus alliaceus]KAB8233909.1 hypothetical protein BDW43DRAFT_310905 [Aspergillus alliaceus]
MKCLPFGRSWPREKCDRCTKYHYACSASITAKEDRQLQQQPGAVGSMITLPRSELASRAEPVIPNPKLHRGTEPGKQADGAPSRPRCAPYFSSLIRASWHYFGLPISSRECIHVRIADLARVETESVYRALKGRLFAVDMGRRYASILQEGLSNKMGLEESRAYASRRVLYEKGKESVRPAMQIDGLQVPEFVREFDRTITAALRWQGLLDAVGVPEILLIGYEEDETEFWEDIPLPDVASASDEEWPSFMNHLLSPALGLKEACLRLSGVADMIQRLKGLDESELRTYLVDNIGQRVKGVLGNEKTLPGYVDDVEDDESMADADLNHDADAPLYGSKPIDLSRA